MEGDKCATVTFLRTVVRLGQLQRVGVFVRQCVTGQVQERDCSQCRDEMYICIRVDQRPAHMLSNGSNRLTFDLLTPDQVLTYQKRGQS